MHFPLCVRCRRSAGRTRAAVPGQPRGAHSPPLTSGRPLGCVAMELGEVQHGMGQLNHSCRNALPPLRRHCLSLPPHTRPRLCAAANELLLYVARSPATDALFFSGHSPAFTLRTHNRICSPVQGKTAPPRSRRWGFSRALVRCAVLARTFHACSIQQRRPTAAISRLISHRKSAAVTDCDPPPSGAPF